MNSAPSFTREQLAVARTARWHQHGDPLLTLDAARDWINDLGLVLFDPRTQQLSAPAPSLVEATLGHAEPTPSAAHSDVARSLVARLTAEGSVLPLNLLGSPGDAPDFVVSAAAFPFVFTLRGDKLWKQPPVNAGAIKVSPLASGIYEKLAVGEALTASELASELGREVTEAAILRSLNELWSQLRVLPLLEQDGSATKWELTTRRFTKAIKQGANAGQPTALSAIISLYLAQSYAATEDEVEVFLSPLTARSRVRDVLHGLTGARQLEEIVLDGKTNLYIPGTLPEFPAIVTEEPIAVAAEGVSATEAPTQAATEERIRRFDRPRTARESRPPRSFASRSQDRASRPSRAGGENRSTRSDRDARPSRPFAKREGDRPFRKPAPYRETPTRSFGSAEGDTERPARPFRKSEDRGEPSARPARPARKFEDRGERPTRSAKPFGKPAFDRGSKPRFDRGATPPFGRKPEGKRFTSSPNDRERRPFQRDRAAGAGRPERATRPDRPDRLEGTDRPARPERSDRSSRPAFTRPWNDDRKPRPRRNEGDRPARPQRAEGSRTDRPKRRDAREDSRTSSHADRLSRPRPSFSEGDRDKTRHFSKARPSGSKPKFGAKRPTFRGKSEGDAASGPRKPRDNFSKGAGQKSFSPGAKKRTSAGSKSFGNKPFRGTSGAQGRKPFPGKNRPFSPAKKRKTGPKSDPQE